MTAPFAPGATTAPGRRCCCASTSRRWFPAGAPAGNQPPGRASDIGAVLAVADVPPVVNQVQFSPFEYRRGLLEFCEDRDVVLEGYSPLGTGRHLWADSHVVVGTGPSHTLTSFRFTV